MEHNKDNRISRRDMLKTSALLGGAVALAGCSREALHRQSRTAAVDGQNDPENIIYTSCLQCNTGCGLKVKLWNGTAVKLDGNPIAPHTLYPHLDADTSPFVMAGIDGAICPKGQAGIQTVYDPYRIRKVLKRAGKRGEGKWVSVDFDQAIREIVEGGALFANVPGEENRVVPGLREAYALRDPKIASAMDKEIQSIKKVIKDVRKKKLPESAIVDAVKGFKAKFAAELDAMIDPDHPDLGPKNNQLVFNWGRMKAGRDQFCRRFIQNAFGSTNAHGHTTVCQGSLYFAGKAMSEQWEYDPKSKEVKWTGGDKFYWQADTANAEFILFVGASPFEGNYGPPGRTPRIVNSIAEGRLKIAVADPRFSKTASKAWKWLPIKPGHEAALAMAMIRWLIENDRFDANYLGCANKGAADAAGEPTWSNGTWLVKINDKGKPDKFVRSHEIGVAPAKKLLGDDGEAYEREMFVAKSGGRLVPVDPNDADHPVVGDLFVTAELTDKEGKRFVAKSSLQLLKEAAFEHSIEQWSEIAGLDPKEVLELAAEFSRHGKKSVADIHRGVSQHTNGFYNCLAFNSLNLLMGSYDWKGGVVKATVWNVTGDKKGEPMECKPFVLKDMHPRAAKPFGISSIRHDVKYEETTIFDSYPAKRPFYPLSSDVYQEVIPSIADQYPYPIKCLIQYMASPVYSLPAGDKLIDALMDTEKLPLFISVDITVGETSMYADYIFPDLSYLERWEFQGSHPSFTNKIMPVRQPAIAPMTEEATVFGETMPISLEAMLLALAEQLQLPGYGTDGFGPGMDFKRPEDLYLKMAANVAAGDKNGEAVPDASDEELTLFETARRHLPKSVFDVEKWRAAAGEANWRKVVYVLNRGGRYEDFSKAIDGDKVKHKYGKLINLYSEKTASAKSAITGKSFDGIARYLPPAIDLAGNSTEGGEFDMKLITHREITMTKSRTAGNYWLTSVLPENALLMNKRDADRIGLAHGDLVTVQSSSNPNGEWSLGHGNKKIMRLPVKVVQGIRPGAVSFGLGYGHWAYGASDVEVDGERLRADPRRAKGAHLNAAMQADPILKNTSLGDPVGGSVAFYDSMVRIVKG
ncbi:MAG: molybdopterin-dependent oxidoreductase [Armatimonadetes bacterium]|nr:molybdopterin-dependent oxidoreductase [Armatimonadota bacterium]